MSVLTVRTALQTQDPESNVGCWAGIVGLGAAGGGLIGGLVGHQLVIWRPLEVLTGDRARALKTGRAGFRYVIRPLS